MNFCKNYSRLPNCWLAKKEKWVTTVGKQVLEFTKIYPPALASWFCTLVICISVVITLRNLPPTANQPADRCTLTLSHGTHYLSKLMYICETNACTEWARARANFLPNCYFFSFLLFLSGGNNNKKKIAIYSKGTCTELLLLKASIFQEWIWAPVTTQKSHDLFLKNVQFILSTLERRSLFYQ